MKIKDFLGVAFCSTGIIIGVIGYRLLGLQWYFGACALIVTGTLFIYSAERDRKLRKALEDVPGDWGDRHYISGASSASDALDSLDFDD
ncbi:hypothetical protein [Undibacterium pigrum]|uniref:Uncharacterized protein n=1 Tax=Undibacterium pigrum TaxID=401470 RepID=A0A318JSA3_9BURK|nr:hypothetical protein [Undibacterium pigrum]PXX43222.1 hypothetical protein DFR42_104223 [Undibacterium pigrum]